MIIRRFLGFTKENAVVSGGGALFYLFKRKPQEWRAGAGEGLVRGLGEGEKEGRGGEGPPAALSDGRLGPRNRARARVRLSMNKALIWTGLY